MKILKWIVIFFIILIVSVPACLKILSKKMPTGVAGNEAELLADDVLTALNKDAWDSLSYVKWTFFRGKHHYWWDKQANNVIIEWGENKVLMDLDQVDGKAFKNATEVQGEEKRALIDEAWGYWCNDSFWLYAPYKIKDPGTTRELVKDENTKGIKVIYESGGVTPGDTYIWWLDENNKPVSWQMWVNILPTKGVKNSWDNWITLPGGAMVATSHKAGPITMKLSNVEAGDTPESIGKSKNDFTL